MLHNKYDELPFLFVP